MSDYYVTTTGTKTTGASTPGDWTTNSNCYGSVQTALNRLSANGDRVVLDDVTHSVAYLETAYTDLATGALLHIVSRSGDPALCGINFSTLTTASFKFNHNSKAFTHLIEGISAWKTGIHATAGASLILLNGSAAGNTEFKDCILKNTTASYSGAGNNAFVVMAFKATPRTLTFTNTKFDQLTTSTIGTAWFAEMASNQNITFNGAEFTNITHTCTTTSNNVGGIVTLATSCTLTMTDIVIDNITSTHASNTAVANYPFIAPLGPLVIDRLHASNMTWTGATSGAAIIGAYNTYDIKDVTFVNIVSTPYGTLNAIGGTFISYGTNSVGTIDGLTAINCTSDFGPVLYCSQGGGGTFDNVLSVNCTARVEGITYFGGWGDCTMRDYSILGGNTGQLLRSFEGYGGAVYAQIHPSATRSKITTLINGYVSGVRQLNDGGSGLLVRGHEAGGYSHTVGITNLVLDNPGQALHMDLQSFSGELLYATATGLSVRGGEDSIRNGNVGSGTTNLGTITEPPATVRRGEVIGSGVTRLAA